MLHERDGSMQKMTEISEKTLNSLLDLEAS